MMSLKDAAAYLGCSKANIYALKDRGLISVSSVGAGGKGYRVAEEELRRFLEDRRSLRGRDAAPIERRCKPVKLKHLR